MPQFYSFVCYLYHSDSYLLNILTLSILAIEFHGHFTHRQCFDIVSQFYILGLNKSLISWFYIFHAKEPLLQMEKI